MNHYLDFRFRSTTWLTLVVALVCVASAYVLPESFGEKNSPIETVQMIVVAIGLCLTCTAKDYKHLFVFASLVLFFVLAREVNYGRTLVIFADPENANKFPKWKDMEYGWIAHVCVGLYMVWLLVYFIRHKVWKEMGAILGAYRLPVMDALLSLMGLVAGVTFECMHNCVDEELGELVLYVGGVGIIYLYSRHKLSPAECVADAGRC